MQTLTDWRRRGAEDCWQDRCENVPFASVGGLEKRSAMVPPKWALGNEDAYLAGYRDAALELFGADWETCSFSWQPAIVIGGEALPTRTPDPAAAGSEGSSPC